MATVEVIPPNSQHVFDEPVLPPYLKANQGRVDGPQLEWLKPTPADTPIEEMRRRLHDDDYIFVKSVLPREDVLRMREHYFSLYEGTSLTKPDTAHLDGIYNSLDDAALHKGIGGGNPSGEDEKRLMAAHVSPDYLSFVAHPRLRDMVRSLMGWEDEVLLRRTMLRHNVPGGESTGVHYDKLFLRGGDAFFLTAWVPIGDITVNGGGLIYLENSAALGQAIEDDFNDRAKDFDPQEKISAFNRNMSEMGVLANHPDEFQRDHQHIAHRIGMGNKQYRWLVANYEAGDVVFHLPCSIHSSSTNADPHGRIRLSTDLRFYDKKDFDQGRADNRWMVLWKDGDGL